jgi:hypothetical protein
MNFWDRAKAFLTPLGVASSRFSEAAFLPEVRPTSAMAALRSPWLTRRLSVGVVIALASSFVALQVNASAADGSDSEIDFALSTYSAGFTTVGVNPATGSGYASGSATGLAPKGANNGHSIQFWTKPSPLSVPSGGTRYVFNLEFKFGIYPSSGTWKYSLGNGSGWISGKTNVDTGVTVTNQWTHIAMIADGLGSVRVYIDGQLASSRSTVDFGAGESTELVLGARYTNHNGNYQGEIDEVKIWSTDRTSSLAADMDTRADPADPDLLGYWDFNEPSGVTIYDRKGVNNLTAFRDADLRNEVVDLAVRNYLPGAFPAAPAPAPFVPTVLEVIPQTITVTNEIVTLFGAGLSAFSEVLVDGKPVELIDVSGNRISFHSPSGLDGTHDITLSGAGQNLVVPEGLRFEVAVKEPARTVIPGFAANSTVLTGAMKKEIRQLLRANPDLNQVFCKGFSSAPATAQDPAFALGRGQVACDFVVKLRPEVQATLRPGAHTNQPGSDIRRVRITLR